MFAQTFTDWELIVSDDGSDVATGEFLRTVQRRPRVRVVWNAHTGRPAAARNAGLREATGEFVAFLDSDDWWTPDKLTRQVEVLRGGIDRLWSYTAFRNVDALGTSLPEEALRRWSPCEGAVFERLLRGEVSIRTPSVMASRRFIEDAGGFDETLRSAEDYDLWLRLSLRSDIALVNQPLVYVRHHRHNHSSDWSSAYVGQDRTFEKLQSGTTGGRRAALRRERARNAIRLAAEYSRRRQHAAALRTVRRSLRFSWQFLEWWNRAFKLAVRALLPERWNARLRRHPRSA